MKKLFALFSSPLAQERQAKQRYAELVESARSPKLYTEFAIPDTLDGRFESIIISLFIEQMHMEKAGGIDHQQLRLLHESFFEDMDRSLREGGVGDTGISKRVKVMAAALYGRLATYQHSWKDLTAFTAALKRNVYATATKEVEDQTVSKLAQFIVQKIKA